MVNQEDPKIWSEHMDEGVKIVKDVQTQWKKFMLRNEEQLFVQNVKFFKL